MSQTAALPRPTDAAAVDPDWYCRQGAYPNLELLFRYLDEHCIDYGRPADVLARPWAWQPEFHAALKWWKEETA